MGGQGEVWLGHKFVCGEGVGGSWKMAAISGRKWYVCEREGEKRAERRTPRRRRGGGASDAAIRALRRSEIRMAR